MDDVLSVGIIGAGSIATDHVTAIEANDNVRLVAVMDVDEDRAKSLAEAHGARAYTSLEPILADGEVEAVVICSPHCFHAEQTLAAAQAGKHVLVEKPMALTVKDCDRMIQACEKAGRILMVGQVMRKSPINLKVRQLIAEGAIGRVGHLMRRRYNYFNTSRPESSYGAWYMDPAIGGNCVLYAFGSHEYDILHWYINSPVRRVYAQGTASTELYRGQRDSFSAVMNHENGTVSLLSQTVVCHSGTSDQYIIGSDGSIAITGGQLMLNGEKVPVEMTPGQAMREQIREFATCCLKGCTPDANGRSVRHTMAVIEAVKQSAERNEPVLVSDFDP